MKKTNSNLIKTIEKNKKKFDVYYKNYLICYDADNFEVFEDKILAILKANYLFIYIIDENNFKPYSTLRKDGAFEKALIFINETRYEINFNCEITCLGRC